MGRGYDPDFLGPTVPAVPLPSFSDALREDVLERDALADDGGGRRIHRHYHHYTLAMSRSRRTALFAALNVDQATLETTDATAGWRVDDAVGAAHQLDGDYYRANAWDRGHLAPDAAAGWGTSAADRAAGTNDTYYYTNATLQHENFNRDEWKDLEAAVRHWGDAATGRLVEITGPVFGAGGATVRPEGREAAAVPDGFFKVLAYVGTGPRLEVRCFAMYQDAASLADRGGVVDHDSCQVSVSRIEQLTGLVFDPLYHEANRGVGGVGTVPQQVASSDESGVFIAAAMVDPVGRDSGNEWISILNRTDETISLQGWTLADQKGRKLVVSSSLLEAEHVEPGVTVTLRSISPMRLVNTGGSLTLCNDGGRVDHVTYTKAQVQEGVAVDLLARS